jgi:type II secretion system protein I
MTPSRTPFRHRRQRAGRRGFSLLEVILALAILMASIAIIGEAMRFGLRNAQSARDKTKAVLYCESKLAEIAAGAATANAVSNAPIEDLFDDSESAWVYSVEAEALDDMGLMSVTVRVRQDLPESHRPVEVSLTRWLGDSSSAAAAAPVEEEQ